MTARRKAPPPICTVGAPAHELRHAEELTVATTGLTALHALADAEGVRIECLGGTLRPLSQGFVGPLTEAALERRSFGRALDGLTGEELAVIERYLQRTGPRA